MQSWQQSAGAAGLQKPVTACRNSACPSPTRLQGCIRKFSVLRNPPKCPPSLSLSCGAVAGEAEPNASLSISTQAHCCCLQHPGDRRERQAGKPASHLPAATQHFQNRLNEPTSPALCFACGLFITFFILLDLRGGFIPLIS